MEGWTVKTTLREKTEEPEGQYNRMVVSFKGTNYEVSGRPFCFAGYSEKSILRKCMIVVDDYLSSGSPPPCPKCGKTANMILHGKEWVCHSTHPKE